MIYYVLGYIFLIIVLIFRHQIEDLFYLKVGKYRELEKLYDEVNDNNLQKSKIIDECKNNISSLKIVLSKLNNELYQYDSEKVYSDKKILKLDGVIKKNQEFYKKFRIRSEKSELKIKELIEDNKRLTDRNSLLSDQIKEFTSNFDDEDNFDDEVDEGDYDEEGY